MATVSYKSNAGKVEQEVRDRILRRLVEVGSFLRSKTVKMISVSSKAAGPSQPGQPPHADTGNLRRTIFSQVDSANLTLTHGTTAEYGADLELGTSKMAPRPYLRRSLAENMADVQRILARK